MTIRIRTGNLNRFFGRLKDLPERVMKRAEPVMQQKTPKKSGNARSKTKLQPGNKSIKAGYPYAKRLNEGWSRQAPNGFTDPTIKYIKDAVRDELGKL